MKVVKPSGARELPRGVVGGAELNAQTAGTKSIFMGVIRIEPGMRSRPHYHDNCESALYMLSGELDIRWGDQLEESVRIAAGDMLYVPPRETHVVHNPTEHEAEYVVARNSATEDAVVVPWADEQPFAAG